MSVSIFASAVRPKIWKSCLDSFQGTSCDFEVVFSGHNTEEEVAPFLKEYPFFKYIHTSRIKPAQNYQVSLNHCTKETVVWFCDDAECNDDVIGKAYRYWKSQENEKLILSIQTRENGYPDGKMFLFDMRMHTFFGNRRSTPLMAPLGMMSRAYLEKLGGYDRRYISGQTENDVVMRAYADGGKVEIFGDKDTYIEIDHWNKSKICNEGEFLKRPFATGYVHDRKILENSWVKDGKVTLERNDAFEPFEDKDLLIKSQSYPGQWE